MSPEQVRALPKGGFKNKHLSVSRLKRWETCPLSFYLHYIKQVPSEQGEAAALGVLLHATLEAFYGWVVDDEFTGAVPMDRALGFFQAAWEESRLSGLTLYQEALDILRAYFAAHAHADHRRILAVEQEFNIQIGEFVVNGYIDRIDKLGDDTIAIVDYKSNRLLFAREELDADLQMSIYALAVRELYPWAKQVRFVFHMLRHNIEQETHRTPQEIDDSKGYVVALGRHTESAREFPAKLNVNCGYCDFRRQCERYQAALEGKEEITKTQDKNDLEQVATERERVAMLAKLMYARKEELDKVIKAKLLAVESFEAAGTTYRVQNAFSTTYPPERTLRLFERAGLPAEVLADRLLTVEGKAVEELLTELKQDDRLPRAELLMLKAEVEAVARRTAQAPRLNAIQVKGPRKKKE